MIIKRIICKVIEDQKVAFHENQKQWSSLSKEKGFIGQVGGWSNEEPLTACIYAFWESQEDYDYFMNEVHDEIFVPSDQGSTYSSIDVRLFDERGSIFRNESELNSVLWKSEYIRVTLAKVREDRLDHFVEMQQKVWSPGMGKSEGMLGGVYSFSQNEKGLFLTLSGWENEVCHHMYVKNRYPRLVEAAKLMEDAEGIVGEGFKVEDEWRVLKMDNC
ncbi:DUF4937 domain-containing protein [Bacillus sp. BHET2]|uniref:YdbC family protein n=1 Tax=Bacillus sp. BHET2 TaxID=2583818 RepID=UPI00110EB8AB|nr:YdbC family protein [Bacillus sp. BHET2]TMU85072.1 DUF4937 domain-containing protein [Bacillus sp. BHET2]